MKKVKFEYCLFQKSDIKGIYDKVVKDTIFPFEFLKFEKPRSNYLLNTGVAHVLQSWADKGKVKTLHTGLIPLGNGIYIGNNVNEVGKLDFILLVYDKTNKQIHFFLLKNRKPKCKTQFANHFIEKIRKEGFTV